jgi:hypothetical protein
MAEISNRILKDENSNDFLKSEGFKNLKNAIPKSCWSHEELNIILAFEETEIIRDKFDLWKFLYKLGENKGYQKGLSQIIQKDFAKLT